MPSLPGHKGSWGGFKPGGMVAIDYSHPLAQGLTICVPMTEGAGFPLDIVRNVRMTTGGDDDAFWNQTRRGPGLKGQNTNSLYYKFGTEGTDLKLPTTS